MKPITHVIVVLGVLLAGAGASAESSEDILQWSSLPALPDLADGGKQIGVAGPFAGVHNDALIVAGGANFPQGPPWHPLPDGKKSPKTYHDRIFVLVKAEKDDPGAVVETAPHGEAIEDGQWYTWAAVEQKLDRRLAYGVSIATPDGLVCVGGEQKRTDQAGKTVTECFADVFVLKWDAKNGRIVTSDKLVGPDDDAGQVAPLPPLPAATAYAAGALVGKTIYVASGAGADGKATRNFWALDLSKKTDAETFVWRALPSWPGPARVTAVAAAQSDGLTDCFYLFSGRDVGPGEVPVILTDGYRYHPKDKSWKKFADVRLKDEPPRAVMAATGIGWGANHILVFGGADGKLFLELDGLDREIKALKADAEKQTDPAERDKLLAEAKTLNDRKVTILDGHNGFSRDVLAYHTITDTWVNVGRQPTKNQVTTTAVQWGKAIVIPSGEIRPGVRTPQINKVTVPSRARFGLLNYAVLVAYLLALVGMGLFFWRRGKTTDDFFKAGGRVPWWAAGISIFGTQLSAITFMTIPAKTFATDWRYLMGNMAIVMVAPFIVLFYLPFFRRLKVTTSYEYLEKRFNLAARLLGSVMFMLFQFGRIGIVLYLPSLAMHVVTGMPVSVCIVLMGVLCIFYTVLGGIEAVIWTDVLQVIVLMGGALLCLALISFQVPGGWNEVNSIAESAGKFRTFDFRFDVTTATFWVLLIGGFGQSLGSYGADQTVVQRYLTTKDEAAARRSIWCNAILCIPASLLFFMMGSALFAFFRTHPGQLNPGLDNPDAIFPLYIVTQLPPGVAGLLIAGVFAAAMSSLDSSMNSVATAVTTDFYRRFKRDAPDRSCLRLARWVTAVIGVLGTAFALAMAQWDIKSLWDQYAVVLGFFLSGLAGLFILAIFTRRPGGLAAVTALVGSTAVQVLLKQSYAMHPFGYAVSGLVSCVIIGVLVGTVLPEKRKSLAGLTIHTIGQADADGST